MGSSSWSIRNDTSIYSRVSCGAAPQKEWQSDLHWAKAIVSANPPRITNPSPVLRTAGADFNSLFLQQGYQYLTITAGAEIWLQKSYWTEFPHYTDIYIGTYSVSFQTSVSVTNPPNMPYTPSGRNSGYTYTTYDYSTSTTDPNGDNVRYQFDWGDGANATTDWYLPGKSAGASHCWTSTGIYYIRVRAQDTFNEWSDWSPSLAVSISILPPPSTPSGSTSGYVAEAYPYLTSTTTPDGDSIYYQFDWGDHQTTTIGPYPSGTTISASHAWATSYTFYVKVRAQDSYCGVWSGWSPSLAVSITVASGGDSCPYVSTWNGVNYVLDNNILSASELSNGTDVEDYYKLEQTLIPQNGKYSLLLSEFENEHSYIDQVRLLAIDHESDVNIAVTPDGEILTYKNPLAPMSAVDNYGNDRLSGIRHMDGNLSDSTTYFNGAAGDFLTLNFGKINSDNAKLILRSDMHCAKICIEIQVKDSAGEWKTVATFTPRSSWAIDAFNLSPYIVKSQGLMVRLLWTAPHNLDYVGLDTTKQEDYEVHIANLISAALSTQGDVKPQLLQSDNVYAELIPGQQIRLEFMLPNNTRQARTYILYTKGHYFKIS